MNRLMALPLIPLSTPTLAYGKPAPPPTEASSAPTSPLLSPVGDSPETAVVIKSEHLIGTLPNGAPVVVRLKVEAQGAPSSLSGKGRHFASTGAHNYWPASGTTDGTTASFSGTVTDSNMPFLIGSPVEVVANASTKNITLTFGPLAGGPFAAQTLVFVGKGRVTIE